MRVKKLTEPVFEAKIKVLVQAGQYLQQHGIMSRHSRPKKAEGILRVAPLEARLAREMLTSFAHKVGRIISEQEARYWFCPECDALLSAGQKYCAECGYFVD